MKLAHHLRAHQKDASLEVVEGLAQPEHVLGVANALSIVEIEVSYIVDVVGRSENVVSQFHGEEL